MDDTDRARVRRGLWERREVIAQRWQEALAPTGLGPDARTEGRRRLLSLTDRAMGVLLDEPFDAAAARAIGAALADWPGTTAAAVGTAHRILGQELAAGLSPEQLVAMHPALLALLGALSEGFIDRVGATIRDEQEAIRDALLAEQHRAEAAVLAEPYRLGEATRGELRGILDASGEALLLLAPDGAVLTSNRRFAEYFPLGEEPVRGRPCAAFRAAFGRLFDDPAAVERLVGGPGDRDEPFTRDVVQVWPVQRTLEFFSAPVRDAAGAWLGRLYAFRDVTHEREVDRMKSEFVAVVSHELRTPLTAITGYVALLLAGDVGEVSPEQQEFLVIVRHNAERLATLIEDLLDLARIEAGQIELRHTAMDIGRVIREVAASFRPQVAQKRQRLVVRAPKGLPAAWGDTEQVTRILTNLLSNAHKYTPEGGRITLVAAAVGDRIGLEVRDTGIGLSPEEQARLFTRFYRATNGTTPGVGGTGLGLAITRALVEAHGGAITVQSSPGQGFTFRLTLPTAPTGGEATAFGDAAP